MCGIVGYVGQATCAPLLLEALKRLAYRGYDSAGLATLDGDRLDVRRAVGKLGNLQQVLANEALSGSVGIGHTRWATHGRPSESNAHPHRVGDVVVVHNGIIENHAVLRQQLQRDGAVFASETDTEIAAHLLVRALQEGMGLRQAVQQTVQRLRGTYALAVMSAREPNLIVVAKHASPLVIGLGDGETFCASDVAALLPHTRRMVFLEDGDVAELRAEGARLWDRAGQPVDRPPRQIDWSANMAEKGGYKHFMLKEIFEQPSALEDTLRGRLPVEPAGLCAAELAFDAERLAALRRVVLIGCGTSYHAAMLGRAYMESLAGLPAVAELASEFRERQPMVGEGDLLVAISQSGETLDTLYAARLAKERGACLLSVCNVVDAALARASDHVFYTHAGPEIGVASTKCFSAQVLALLLVAMHLAVRRGVVPAASLAPLVQALRALPQQMQAWLASSPPEVLALARRHHQARDVLFLGRGWSYPIALEGALKLKEISYVHAEGYAAGEMKHGPIALLDAQVPVIGIVPQDGSHARTLSNLHEAKARDAQIIVIANQEDEEVAKLTDEIIRVPSTDERLSPLLTMLPLQLYAYHVADLKGTDVDQPRNLAKTVTVE